MERELATPTPTRAPRYIVRVPVRFRPRGEKTWLEGRSENIGKSGLLFRADHVMPLHTPIEMVFAIDTDSGGIVICRGRIVRVEAGNETDSRSAMAATIANYRLLHSPEHDPQRV